MTEHNKKFEVTYEKVNGSRIRKEDAQEIGEILGEMAAADSVHPQDVVAAAADPDSVLHKYFTWDDEIAARKQRLTVAGYIIRSMNMRVVYAQIVKESEKNAPPREVSVVRMLQSTKDLNEGYVYKSTFEVLGDPDATNQCYFNMYTYLMGAFRRFHTLDDLAEDLIDLEAIIINLASRLGKTKTEAKNHIAKIRRGV